MNRPSILLVAEGEDARTLGRALEPVAAPVSATAGAELGEQCRRLGVEVAVVAVGADRESALRQVAALVAAGARVVVAGPTKDPDLILGALRAGAREFVVASDGPELGRVIRALGARGAGEGRGLGQLVTVFPTRGGVGATTLAVNLAGALARRHERTCLLDLDLHLGDVLSFLDLPGSYSVSDVIANASRLDRELLDRSVDRHASGLAVLAQSGKVEQAAGVRPAELAGLLDFLRRQYDHLVVDGLGGFDELSLAVLDASQQIVMVLTQDVPSVRSARRCLELFRRLGYGDQKIRLVVNRHQRASTITPDVIAESVGLPVAHTLGNDFASAIEAINRGRMLAEVAPRSPLHRDIEAMAPAVAGETRSPDPKRGFFRALLSRKGNDETPRAA